MPHYSCLLCVGLADWWLAVASDLVKLDWVWVDVYMSRWLCVWLFQCTKKYLSLQMHNI